MVNGSDIIADLSFHLKHLGVVTSQSVDLVHRQVHSLEDKFGIYKNVTL